MNLDKELEKVRNSFEGSPFYSLVGFEIIYFEKGNVKIKLPITNKLLNTNETLHGGVHDTMLDTIMEITIRTNSKTRFVTIRLNINYPAPSVSGSLYATGKVIKQGYRIVTAEGELVDEKKNLVAKGLGSFKLVR